MMLISKFGGSSMANATQFEKVKNIVLSNDARQVVVVSALGKREKSDTKITDLLYTLAAHLKYNVAYEEIWNIFFTRFVEVKNKLGLKQDIESELNKLKNELNSHTPTDYLVSRGEYFTAMLIAEYLGYKFVDAKDIISFNYDGTMNNELTEENAKKAFKKYGRMVVPGFYGAFPNGSIRLLSRGGSDITGSILASALNADIYENWTDVSGVCAADPRIVDNPRNIKEITYAELREMSYMGANVLHEETVFPVQALQIPINIKNTNEPTHPGTMIKNSCTDNTFTITGIAGRKDFIVFNIFKDHMSTEIGYLRKVLSVFEKYGVSIEHLPSGIDSFSVICFAKDCEKVEYEIATDIKRDLGGDVTVDHDLALIAIVGRNMINRSGICGKIFSVLGNDNINVKMIDQGPTELSIIVGVSCEDYDDSIRAIYRELIQNEVK